MEPALLKRGPSRIKDSILFNCSIGNSYLSLDPETWNSRLGFAFIAYIGRVPIDIHDWSGGDNYPRRVPFISPEKAISTVQTISLSGDFILGH